MKVKEWRGKSDFKYYCSSGSLTALIFSLCSKSRLISKILYPVASIIATSSSLHKRSLKEISSAIEDGAKSGDRDRESIEGRIKLNLSGFTVSGFTVETDLEFKENRAVTI